MRPLRISSVLICAALYVFAQDSDAPKKKGKKTDPSDIGARKVDGGLNFYSIEKELALGRQLAIEVEKQAKMFDDPIVTEYVNRLCQTLARHSDVTFPVSIKIVESDQLNAFTLPGGHLFIDTGLIRLSESESELAAAIAHELAHVAARHATRQATASKMANIATIPLIFVSGPLGAIVQNVANVAIPMGFFKFSRVFEAEADMLGLQYMYDAGYDPSASVDIFERLESMEKKKPGTVGQLFNTHPVTADRINKSQKNIQAILPPKPEYVVNTSDYEEVRQRLVGILDARRMNPAADKKPTLLKPNEHPFGEH
jgi:beta-barrel assembly-enhancing protease